jgi:hypothetical protein
MLANVSTDIEFTLQRDISRRDKEFELKKLRSFGMVVRFCGLNINFGDMVSLKT